jgi:hypothetical protein
MVAVSCIFQFQRGFVTDTFLFKHVYLPKIGLLYRSNSHGEARLEFCAIIYGTLIIVKIRFSGRFCIFSVNGRCGICNKTITPLCK